MITQSQVNLYGISVDILEDWWPHVTDHLQKAIDRADGKWNLEGIYQKLLTKDMQLWVIVSDKILAAGTTQVCVYPLKKVLIVSFLGGESFDLWKDKIHMIEQVGREWGCDDIEIQGRKGWERAMKEFDYEPTYYVIRKHLWPQD